MQAELKATKLKKKRDMSKYKSNIDENVAPGGNSMQVDSAPKEDDSDGEVAIKGKKGGRMVQAPSGKKAPTAGKVPAKKAAAGRAGKKQVVEEEVSESSDIEKFSVSEEEEEVIAVNKKPKGQQGLAMFFVFVFFAV